jgi:hypothetical protein
MSAIEEAHRALVRQTATALDVTSPYSTLIEQLQGQIADIVSDIDLKELSGFDEATDALAETAPQQQIDELVEQLPAMLPDESTLSLEDLSALVDPELIEWAASINIGESAPFDEEAEETGDASRLLRDHLAAVAVWTYRAATMVAAAEKRFHAGAQTVNERVETYRKLCWNLITLYVAIEVIIHLL